MPGNSTPFAALAEAAEAYRAAIAEGWTPAYIGQPGVRSAVHVAADRIGLTSRNLRTRLEAAAALGLEVPGWPAMPQDRAAAIRRRYSVEDPEYAAWAAGKVAATRRAAPAKVSAAPRSFQPDPPAEPKSSLPTEGGAVTPEAVLAALRRGPATLSTLAQTLRADGMVVAGRLAEMAARGTPLQLRGDTWSLASAPPTGIQAGSFAEIVTDADGRVTLGAIGDTHLCSKYERLDCLEAFYDQAQAAGARIVLHAGNYVEGEASFNTYDIKVHGLDPQVRYLAEHYPHRDGMQTWAITGADHEGWWAKREAVDVGRYVANAMREAGREDWRDLGFMEAYVRLVHPATGAGCMLHLMHPGGGSAYAVSYAPQKIVEAYDGGDKPAVLLIGHYHKLSYNLARNVHAVQVGCFQDQTPFMRQKKLAAHLGGVILGLRLDAATGACVGCSVDIRNFFVRDYYAGRWSMHGPAAAPPRAAGSSGA